MARILFSILLKLRSPRYVCSSHCCVSGLNSAATVAICFVGETAAVWQPRTAAAIHQIGFAYSFGCDRFRAFLTCPRG